MKKINFILLGVFIIAIVLIVLYFIEIPNPAKIITEPYKLILK